MKVISNSTRLLVKDLKSNELTLQTKCVQFLKFVTDISRILHI